jgi:hypothetical protein
MKKLYLILIMILALFSLFFIINSVAPICSSHGLQPIQLDCNCNGLEFNHVDLPFIFGVSEGYETQCIGKIESKACKSGDKILSCEDYIFGFGTIRKIK